MTYEELQALVALEGKKLGLEQYQGYYSLYVFNDHFDYEFVRGTSIEEAVNRMVSLKYNIENANH